MNEATTVATTVELSEKAQRKIQRGRRRRQIRYQLFQRDPRCRYCHRSIRWFKQSTLDHVKPKSKGGTDNPRNLVLCCHRCNKFKDADRPGQLMLWALRVLRVAMVRRILFVIPTKGGAA